MSILINMEMPTSPVLFCIHPDGKVFADLEGNWREYKAVTVPPHGRLIAEDDAIKTAWMILRGLGYFKEENPQLEQTVREVFATAPTIEVE